jgi:hypothetical protein
MNKKTIEIIIIVVMFSGAGFVLYNGFFKNSTPPINPLAINPLSTGVGDSPIPSAGTLPITGKFNFDFLTKQKLNYEFEVVKVDPEKEVGKNVNDLVKPTPAPDAKPATVPATTTR